MDEIKDIFFDATELLTGLRKETKAWALTFKNSADAIRAVLGTVKTTIRTVEKQAKRTVASFDQIQRLEGKDVTVTKTVTTQEGALDTLSKAVGDISGEIKNVIKTVLGALDGKVTKTPKWDFTSAVQDLGSILTKVSALRSLLRGDTSMALWVGTMSGGFSTVTDKLNAMGGIFKDISGYLSRIGTTAGYVWESVAGVFGNAASWFVNNVTNPVRVGMHGVTNYMIGLINGAMKAVSTATNAFSKILNGFSLKIPDWVPILGGKSFGFKLPAFTAPAIPMLAQGAVLPANKPFLAMVGDQKHGTNIEAPLTTIQEAVALVLDDQIGAITAGFEASIGVQREILEAVLGIRIGDELIASAGDRYRQKMAVARGGVL